MKIIFLDIDGVLISRASSSAPLKSIDRPAGADPSCVSALNTITDATGANLVVSSMHRLGVPLVRLRELISGWGVKAPVVGKTPRLHVNRIVSERTIEVSAPRGTEIQKWLDQHEGSRFDPECFVILDDDCDMEHLSHRLVKTQFEPGLTMADAELAISMLSEVPA